MQGVCMAVAGFLTPAANLAHSTGVGTQEGTQGTRCVYKTHCSAPAVFSFLFSSCQEYSWRLWSRNKDNHFKRPKQILLGSGVWMYSPAFISLSWSPLHPCVLLGSFLFQSHLYLDLSEKVHTLLTHNAVGFHPVLAEGRHMAPISLWEIWTVSRSQGMKMALYCVTTRTQEQRAIRSPGGRSRWCLHPLGPTGWGTHWWKCLIWDWGGAWSMSAVQHLFRKFHSKYVLCCLSDLPPMPLLSLHSSHMNVLADPGICQACSHLWALYLLFSLSGTL
jgi:hypothetical protein